MKLVKKTLEHRIRKAVNSDTSPKEWLLGIAEISLYIFWLTTGVTVFSHIWPGWFIPITAGLLGSLRLFAWIIDWFPYRRLTSLIGFLGSVWTCVYSILCGYVSIEVWVMSIFVYANAWLYFRLGKTHGI